MARRPAGGAAPQWRSQTLFICPPNERAQEFVEMAADQLVGQYPVVLGVVLANISHPSREIVEVRGRPSCALCASVLCVRLAPLCCGAGHEG